jgi:hypothetical protein
VVGIRYLWEKSRRLFKCDTGFDCDNKGVNKAQITLGGWGPYCVRWKLASLGSLENDKLQGQMLALSVHSVSR